jgi:type I restriction enzyme M protein
VCVIELLFIEKYAPLQLHSQEFTAGTWAMRKMNMVIHDTEGEIEIGDTLKNPRFREGGTFKKFINLYHVL